MSIKADTYAGVAEADLAQADAIKALLIEVTHLHHHTAQVSRALAGQHDLTNAQVSVLRSLAAAGPLTVPQLARERAIARQPVQRLADELVGLGLVRFEPNPRHRRSQLVTLTGTGKRRLRTMERRQTAWVSTLESTCPERSLRAATRLLRNLREEMVARASQTQT